MGNNGSSSHHEDPSFVICAESNDIWSKFRTDLEKGHTENVVIGNLVAGVNKAIDKSTQNKRFQRALLASKVTTWLFWTALLGLTLLLLIFTVITLGTSRPTLVLLQAVQVIMIGEFVQEQNST